MIRRTLILALPAILISAPVGAVDALMEAPLLGEHVVPPAQTDARGEIRLEVDDETNEVIWLMTFEGLSGPPTAITLRGPAGEDANGEILSNVIGSLSSPVLGGSTLSSEAIGYLLDGLVYVLVATEAFPDGELRAQLAITGFENGGSAE